MCLVLAGLAEVVVVVIVVMLLLLLLVVVVELCSGGCLGGGNATTVVLGSARPCLEGEQGRCAPPALATIVARSAPCKPTVLHKGERSVSDIPSDTAGLQMTEMLMHCIDSADILIHKPKKHMQAVPALISSYACKLAKCFDVVDESITRYTLRWRGGMATREPLSITESIII